MPEILVFMITGIFVGILIGLLGVGGGLIIVPVLYFFFTAQDLPTEHIMHMALATSLSTIIVTSPSSMLAHHRKQAVLWPIALRITPGICIGAWLGGIFASQLTTEILKPAFDDIQENEARFRILQKDIVHGIQTVKAAAAEKPFSNMVLNEFSTLSRSQSLSNFNIFCYDGTVQALGFLSTILLLWLGAQLVLYEKLSMGGFIAFQMLTTMSYFPILTILNMWEDLQLSSVLLTRLDDIIESTSPQAYE